MEEKRVVSTVKKVMPAVVSIMIAKHLKDVEKELSAQLPHIFPNVKKPKKIAVPDQLVDAHGMVQVGGGSGFVVHHSGIVLTNKHVIADPKAEYTVVTADGKNHPARIISIDPINDVAILKIPVEGFPAVLLGDASGLELGSSVMAIGNALGLFKNTVSLGIVSGLSRAISAHADPTAPPQELRGLVQTDAAINPGNSGGPLVNMRGEAVGINVATVFGAQSIGFAIPIESAKKDLEDVKKYGHIKRPFLGVRYVVIDENLKAKMKLPVDYGAYVVPEGPNDHGVVLDSPADKAGIKEKDIILSFNNKKITREHPIQDFLENAKPGDEALLKILRGKKRINVEVKLTERK